MERKDLDKDLDSLLDKILKDVKIDYLNKEITSLKVVIEALQTGLKAVINFPEFSKEIAQGTLDAVEEMEKMIQEYKNESNE
jgi:hypothetical protein